MRDGLDLSRRTLRRARHRPLRLCAILAGVAAALAAAAVLWGLDLPRRLDDCLAVRYETQAAALRQEIFVLRAQLAAHTDDAQENAALRDLIGSSAAKDAVWQPFKVAARWPGGFLPGRELTPGAAVLDRKGRFAGTVAQNGAVDLAGIGAGAVPCTVGPALGVLTRRGDALVLTGLPRDCAAAAGDTVVTARGEHWVGTAAAPPALDDAGLTAELILQDTAGGTDYLYFAEGDKTGQDGV